MNTTGGTNRVTWTGTGTARVDFPGLGRVQAGNVQVTAYGAGTRCKVSNWDRSGTTLRAFVTCHTATGTLASRPFALSYVSRVEGGYVRANQPTAASYTPTEAYQWNSAGGLNTVTRWATGSYTVSFPGQNGFGGTAEVTAFGSGSGYCKAESWYPSGDGHDLNVRCFAASGTPTDIGFSAKLAFATTTEARSFGYAWADQPSTASYEPNDNYQRVSVATECGQFSRGPITITRSAVGRYLVTFKGLPGGPLARTHVKVTGYGAGPETCKIESWSAPANDPTAQVSCFAANGTAVDALYVITYSSTGVVIC